MLFSSIPFLFWFLPGVLILYAAAPGSLKNTVLLLSSLFFYGWGEPRYVIWMMLAILMAYIFGLLIERYQSVPKLAIRSFPAGNSRLPELHQKSQPSVPQR